MCSFSNIVRKKDENNRKKDLNKYAEIWLTSALSNFTAKLQNESLRVKARLKHKENNLICVQGIPEDYEIIRWSEILRHMYRDISILDLQKDSWWSFTTRRYELKLIPITTRQRKFIEKVLALGLGSLVEAVTCGACFYQWPIHGQLLGLVLPQHDHIVFRNTKY